MDTSVVYRMAVERHEERVVRGEATERLGSLLVLPAVRDRITGTLIALARWLAPTTVPARPEASLAPATPA